MKGKIKMSDYSGKTNINVQEIKIIPITDEDEGTYDTTNAVDLTGRAKSVSFTPNVKKAQLYGDGEVQETVVDTTTGTLTLALNYLTDADRQKLFGETAEKGSNVVTGDEQPVPCVVIFKTLCTTDGKIVNLYKFFTVTFSPNEEAIQQIEDGITYSTVQITGEYRVNKHNRSVRATRRHVDTSVSANTTIIESWFTTPEYVGPTQ